MCTGEPLHACGAPVCHYQQDLLAKLHYDMTLLLLLEVCLAMSGEQLSSMTSYLLRVTVVCFVCEDRQWVYLQIALYCIFRKLKLRAVYFEGHGTSMTTLMHRRPLGRSRDGSKHGTCALQPDHTPFLLLFCCRQA